MMARRYRACHGPLLGGLATAACLLALYGSPEAVWQSSFSLRQPARNPVVESDPFQSPAADVDWGGEVSYNGTVTVAADVFLVDGCVKFASVLTCQLPFMDFTQVHIEVVTVWELGPCAGGAGDGATSCMVERAVGLLPRPPTTLFHRDQRNWEPATIGELCVPELSHAESAEVVLHFNGVRKRYSLSRIEPLARQADFAMVALYRGDVWSSPAWVDAWRAAGVGHFYIYYNGALGDLRAEHPSVVSELEANPFVTLQTWDFPFRSVIVDPTRQPGNPVVKKYGSVSCYLHFSKMMAYNDAYHRYRSRHSWMGFYDFDEYPGINPRMLLPSTAAPRHIGRSPLQTLFLTYRAASAGSVVMANRWTALLPKVNDEVSPLRSSTLAQRHLYGAPPGDYATRMKFFARGTADGGVQQQLPAAMIGNHFVCSLDTKRVVGWTEIWDGGCKPLVEPASRRIPAEDAYSLHILNLKAHVSTLDEGTEESIQAAVDANAEIADLHALLALPQAVG